jgi:hypothetical protein
LINEEEQDYHLHQYLSLHSHTIIGFIDIPEDRKVRILIRNPAGKYAWDLKYFYHDLSELDGTHYCDLARPSTNNFQTLKITPKRDEM